MIFLNSKDQYILAIESSCDDTSAAVLKNRKVLSNVIANQEVHAKYGGVVPELASRAHQQNIIPVVQEALKEAGIKPTNLTAVAFTRGPGLMGSLLVGSSFAKSMSMGLKIPLVDVNHMQGHILAHFIDSDEKETPKFPFICLTISGGHTQLIEINDFFDFKILGETIDDAVGEAFDKSAKILGLPYPGGPLIDYHAKMGNPKAFSFTKPKVGDLEFSFSGLKTGILYFIRRELKKNPNFIQENLNDICASIQHTIVEILFDKIKKAVKQTGIKEVAIAGGVSANSEIRKRLIEAQDKYGWNTYIPKFEYTTDNAAMIGITAYFKLLENYNSPLNAKSTARLKVTDE